MIFRIKKEGKEYVVKNKMTNAVKGVRSSQSAAQKLARQLERDHRRVGFKHVIARGTEGR
ncbi:MAG: hypothetical protein WCF57_20145 [Pyrinomonadaceae bacterium]